MSFTMLEATNIKLSTKFGLSMKVCESTAFVSDSSGIRTHKHLVRKPTLNHLPKLLATEFPDNQATIECRFTLKHVHDNNIQLKTFHFFWHGDN